MTRLLIGAAMAVKAAGYWWLSRNVTNPISVTIARTMTAWTVVVGVALVLSACTPGQVQQWAADVHGLELIDEQAEFVAGWVDTDCLPDYDAAQVVECAVKDAAARYGLDEARLARVVQCESGFRADAVNARSGATGPSQFLHSTWEWVDELGAPWTHLGIDDARANIFTAAWLISRDDLGGIGHWAASAHCHGWRS